jgi:hypothetical protein
VLSRKSPLSAQFIRQSCQVFTQLWISWGLWTTLADRPRLSSAAAPTRAGLTPTPTPATLCRRLSAQLRQLKRRQLGQAGQAELAQTRRSSRKNRPPDRLEPAGPAIRSRPSSADDPAAVHAAQPSTWARDGWRWRDRQRLKGGRRQPRGGRTPRKRSIVARLGRRDELHCVAVALQAHAAAGQPPAAPAHRLDASPAVRAPGPAARPCGLAGDEQQASNSCTVEGLGGPMSRGLVVPYFSAGKFIGYRV